jgi:ribosome biogenesis GTPase A
MAGALRMIDAELKLCDIIIYVLDARCPRSCLNPKFGELLQRKPVLFVLNKADLAPAGTVGSLRIGGIDYNAIAINSVQSGAGKRVVAAVNRMLADKIAAARAKGITKAVRAIVIGVTNSGKSTFINNLAGRAKALTGDRPGVTRAKQWVQVGAWGQGTDLLLLDTPGVLWPSFENPQVAKNLAYVGSIKDDVLNTADLARGLISDLARIDPRAVLTRFGATDFEGICVRRGYILKGGAPDEERAAKAVLTEFRAGRIGKFNLDALL